MWLRSVKPYALREWLFWKLYGSRRGLNRNLFKDVELEFAPGVHLALEPSDIGHREIAALGYTERALSLRLRGLAEQGGILIDVGANYGYFTCLWAVSHPANKVIAFEASVRNFRQLENNLEKTRLAGQVELARLAAGRARGFMAFDLGPPGQTGWGGLVINAPAASVQVEVAPLDEFMRERLLDAQVVQVLKIDTEGADTWVLQGAKQMLKAHKIKHIFFEENRERMAALGIDPAEAPAFLKLAGYQVEKLAAGEWHAFV